MIRALSVAVTILLTLSASAGTRRRAVRAPFDDSAPAAWLATHAHPLASTELQPFSFDLEPLRAMIGDADVVTLGEGTHGTHEFHTVKLRVVDFLVRELGFDVVVLEAPFPLCNRLNTWILGGAGDPKAMLRELWSLNYFFWNDEEILALIEWMRTYNATRGERPPVQLAGMDVLDQVSATKEVVGYLRTVDPPAAVQAEDQYFCIELGDRTSNCYTLAENIRNTLASREAELVPRTSAAAFHDALQNARVVVQSRYAFGPERDRALAENALWLREHRGTTRRIVVWAHSEHASRTNSEWAGAEPMGRTLANALGNDYFVLTTLTGAGSFHQWATDTVNGGFKTITSTFAPVQPQSYESYFEQSSSGAFLVSLRGATPEWLSTATRYNAGATTQTIRNAVTGSLPAKFDAAIYIKETTPTRLLDH